MNYEKNRMHNAGNPYQGNAKKVLCCCSAGLLRSPTTANVLHREFGYNTRAVGLSPEFALVPVDKVLLHWADEVVVMDVNQWTLVKEMLKEYDLDVTTPVYNLDVPDEYEYMDVNLQNAVLWAYKRYHSNLL